MSGDVDRLATMARVAALREERALRAWHAANAERDACREVRDEAARVHRAASARADGARGTAMADPLSEQAWIWTAATRAAQDDRQAARVQAEQAHDDAVAAAARKREDHGRSHARASTIDGRVSVARRLENRRREDRQAEDVVHVPKARA